MNETNRIKILAVGAGPFVKRGVESFLLNVYTYINHEIISIDFLTPDKCENNSFVRLTERYGDRVIELNVSKKKLGRYFELYNKLEKFLKENKYDIIHINTGNLIPMSVAVLVSYRTRVNRRIVHSHNGGIVDNKFKLIKLATNWIIKKYPTDYLACSQLAGEFIYPPSVLDKLKIIPNGIDLKKYKYSETFRKKIRKHYELNDQVVLGHVGAFISQKNHLFLIEMFNDLLKKCSNYKLVLIGEGELMQSIKSKVIQLGIDSKVIFVGKSHCIEKWLSAFDVFVFPSLFEGLPVSIIEAQAAGLKCILSDRITREVAITNKVEFLSISDGTEVWCNKLEKVGSSSHRDDIDDSLGRYEIHNVVRSLEQIYLSDV